VDSFEHVIAAILERRGYWTRTCVKVALEADEKRAIGRTTAPRWELDVVGYQGRENRLLVLECKSFLDSSGVSAKTFAGLNAKDEKRYKLFFEERTREVVLGRLVKQLVESGFCRENPSVAFGLAAGKIHGDDATLIAHFRAKGWELWTPSRIRSDLIELRDSKYENSIAAVVAKIILRGSAEAETDEGRDE